MNFVELSVFDATNAFLSSLGWEYLSEKKLWTNNSKNRIVVDFGDNQVSVYDDKTGLFGFPLAKINKEPYLSFLKHTK